MYQLFYRHQLRQHQLNKQIQQQNNNPKNPLNRMTNS